MAGIEVVNEDLSSHPWCPHGPTILFSRFVNGVKRNFFACSACRDRKHCSFFLWEDQVDKFNESKKNAWEQETKKFLKGISHRKLFKTLNDVQNLSKDKRIYCQKCNSFEFDKFLKKHEGHNILKGISDYQLSHPSEILEPLENAKKEAQFLFSKSSVEEIVDILKGLKYQNIICIGTPRIHEYIQHECSDMSSILLDIDERFHNFMGPLQFCWYNSFNHHFFFDEARSIFEDFLQNNRGTDMALIMDPPFGGRVEPLAQTINTINLLYKSQNRVKNDLPVFWAFPYFMEPQILNSLPNYNMMDYKIEYDNHPLFQDGPKGRKHGSPVRFFTNIDLRLIKLPDNGYKHCDDCKKWVSIENNHCKICGECTSKDGRTYKHCEYCNKCVKPTWSHCDICKRCVVTDHKCGEILFTKECFHCKKPGHKKKECPEINQQDLYLKRKKGLNTKNKKKKRIK